jgi:hypothetical protein
VYPGWIGYWFSCYLCRSVWAGFACWIALLIFPQILVPLALSTASIAIYKRVM